MKRPPLLMLGCLGSAWLGLILSGSVLLAAQPARGATVDTPLVSDVELDTDGSLRGVVVNVQGVPVAGAPIEVRKAGRKVADTATDDLGCFSVPHLRGGTYQVVSGRYTRVFRTWVASTAPPETRRIALIVVGSDVVRGQVPLGEFFSERKAENRKRFSAVPLPLPL